MDSIGGWKEIGGAHSDGRFSRGASQPKTGRDFLPPSINGQFNSYKLLCQGCRLLPASFYKILKYFSAKIRGHKKSDGLDDAFLKI